jgi:hemolysin III
MHQDERLNWLTHLIGATLALGGIVILVAQASLLGDPWKIVSFSVYGLSLFILYLFSTLYHGLHGRAKAIFQKLDHAAIYLLIAGSYTPFTLTVLRGSWGWSLFGIVWSLALVGIVIDAQHRRGKRAIQMAIYFTMGWLILIAFYPLMQKLPGWALVWLVVGGLCYSGGIVFYAVDEKYRYAHAIWHLFVLAGSASHYFTVLFYLL